MKAVLFVCLLASSATFAQVVPVEAGLSWIGEVLAFLKAIPVVGPYIKIVAEIMAAIAVFTTAMAGFLKAILSISYVAAMKFAPGFGASIKKFEEKVLPWIKYMSMMNVEKKDLEKASMPKIML